MAKYTETFAEYLDGGGYLPSSSFALITDFEDLFKERYCGLEIGFETEQEFAMKLDLKARLVMPIYAGKVTAVDGALNRVKAPIKQRTETRDYGKQHSENESSGTSTDLPFDASTATPSGLSHMEGEADVDAHKDTIKLDDYVTMDENLKIIEELGRKRAGVIEACLEEFKPLFMGVYS